LPSLELVTLTKDPKEPMLAPITKNDNTTKYHFQVPDKYYSVRKI